MSKPAPQTYRIKVRLMMKTGEVVFHDDSHPISHFLRPSPHFGGWAILGYASLVLQLRQLQATYPLSPHGKNLPDADTLVRTRHCRQCGGRYRIDSEYQEGYPLDQRKCKDLGAYGQRDARKAFNDSGENWITWLERGRSPIREPSW